MIGGFLAYPSAATLWNSHVEGRRFDALITSPAMRDLTRVARDYLKSRPAQGASEIYKGKVLYHDGAIWEFVSTSAHPEQPTSLGLGSRVPSVQEIVEAATLDELKKTGSVIISLKSGAIEQVQMDKDGFIVWIEGTDGDVVRRPVPPDRHAYFVPALYPVLGFLLPWGVVKVVTWIADGFFIQTRS
jgi:hypothetical protein